MDRKNLLLMQEYNGEAVQKTFRTAHAHGSLDAVLRSHFAQYVPAAFSGKLDAEMGREERKAKRVLFRPMETFMCNGEPDEMFRRMKEFNNPPQLCGKVFKMGEPTYSCRDCGMDPTCVLCIECFQKSAHKKHRYKMSTSGGGGYCDCGDQEAWKTEPFCDIHKMGARRQESADPVGNLPVELRERAVALFRCAVKYAAEMLLWTECSGPPDDLKPAEMDTNFITMLFNDEVHTYDQVISTLQRAISCTQKEAVDLATTVDREGRTPVLYGNHEACERVQGVIERQTSRQGSKPLKVLVMHVSVVVHQTFAQKVLSWIQHITGQADGLRKLFCELSMCVHQDQEMSTVESMMLADTKLWKAARVQSHQLFMAGILMDQQSKKQFAILFTKMYPSLMKDFIQDDHDHSVSAVSESVQIFTVPTLLYPQVIKAFIEDDHKRSVSTTSCSVQLFTVPTVARMLITDYNLLEVILQTFLLECQPKKKDGIFQFDRQDRMYAFRRAQYMLFDLKYALTFKPAISEWCDPLRVNFMNGVRALLELLQCMEGMDPVTRQTRQHIEFEPEWEGAFNLQLKLAENLCMMQDWCGTDCQVLQDTFLAAIDALGKTRVKVEEMVQCTVAGHEVECIKYDVATQPVSIHLPVTRFHAGLNPKLNKFDISIQGLHNMALSCERTKLLMRDFIEYPLRCQVLIAQTQAGMWRRNGYSLLNQIYFYHNVKCRTEMYDKDILMLQAGAALMDSNEFCIHLLNKFGLSNWIKSTYDDSAQDDTLRHIVTLGEEFLGLLIIILGERYKEGVGMVASEDAVKRELVHQLCIGSMAHSELSKALPEDPYHETGIDDVVKEVATFKKPSGLTGKGLYELKEEFYKEYNPFFYHYSRQEQSKSEEAQRKRKKAAGLDQALPPPKPPPFCQGFQPIVNLLYCDVMILVMKTVLGRLQERWSRSWSDTQLEKVLHLIGLALHEERRLYQASSRSFPFIDKATCGTPSVFSLLETLRGHPKVTHDAQKDLLAWVVKNFTEVRQLRDSSFTMETRSPHSTKLDEKAEREKKKRADQAAKRRAKIMMQMSKLQRAFIEDNVELFESTSTELPAAGSNMDISQLGLDANMFPVCIGSRKSPASTTTSVIRHTCILCQEEQDVLHHERAMVLAAFVQTSTVLSASRGKSVSEPEEYDPLFMPADMMTGPHTSTCGHVMHSDCWQRFFDAIVQRERRRTFRFRQHLSYDMEKQEFLCPLCETLSNTVIPIIPHLASLLKDSEKQAAVTIELSLQDWLDGIQKTIKSSIQQAKDKESEEESFLFVPCPLSSITKMMAESVAKNFQLLFDYVYDDASAHFSDTITEMLRKFSSDVYATGLGVHPNDENSRVPILAWSTCAFTIMTTEQCLRDEGKPLFGPLPSRQADCLSALVRFSAVCSQVIQPDVVKKHCVTLLSALVCDSADKHLQETPCILDMDMFHYMVTLCLSLPTLYAEDDPTSTKLNRIPTGDLNDSHVMHLSLTAHLVQVMLAANIEQQESMEMGSEEQDEEGEALVAIYSQLRKQAGLDTSRPPSCWQLRAYITEACLPFLRCCGLFFHYMTGVYPPEALSRPTEEEFDLLCCYLSMPTCLSTLFSQGDILNHLVHSWCTDETVKKRLSAASSEKVLHYPVPVNQHVKLPADYSELINKVSTFTCPKSDGDDSRAPTMCLVCGTVLCSQSYCCQSELGGITVGAATAHANSCGAGVGIFLRVRECQVLLLSGRTKGCFFAPPYLDDYGETDQGLRRGNPLHLCEDRYKKLHKLWLSHGIPEEIAHLLESNSSLLTIEWQHL